MSKDVMADYKSSRFVVVDPVLGFGSRTIVLADMYFWVKHHDALEEWCQLHTATIKGMTVELQSDEDLTLFTLRWL